MQWEGIFGAFHNRDESQSVWAKYLEPFCHLAMSDGDGCGLPSLLPLNQNCQQFTEGPFFFIWASSGVDGEKGIRCLRKAVKVNGNPSHTAATIRLVVSILDSAAAS